MLLNPIKTLLRPMNRSSSHRNAHRRRPLVAAVRNRSHGSAAIAFVAIAALLAACIIEPAATYAFDVNIPDDEENYVGAMLIVTENTPRETGVVYCGLIYDEYRCLFVHPSFGAKVLVAGIDENFNISAGDRFEIDAQAVCEDRLIFMVTQRRTTSRGFHHHDRDQ